MRCYDLYMEPVCFDIYNRMTYQFGFRWWCSLTREVRGINTDGIEKNNIGVFSLCFKSGNTGGKCHNIDSIL
jgi:hypothetical protein